MDEKLNQSAKILLNEERIKYVINLRKMKLNQRLFIARQRQFNIEALKQINGENNKKTIEHSNTKKKNIILKFKEDNYFIDPDDIDINENLNSLKFVQTDDIIKNITDLLNNVNEFNSILYGVLMMRKFTVIDAVLINKSNLFIKNTLYFQICNILNTYYNNKKLVFEGLWILSSLVFDSKDKNMYNFLLSDKCIKLYNKILLFHCDKNYDTNIIKVMSIFILNMLIFKQKEYENENNIINCDNNDEYLLEFLNEIVDLILYLEITEEIFISLLIEITNCFDLQILLKNDLLNKIIIYLTDEVILNIGNKSYYYEEEIKKYYENGYKSSKIKINSIYQIILIQLQYLMTHPLKEMPNNYFKKLANEIINETEVIKDDVKHLNFYFEYINSYINYLMELNLSLSYEEAKNVFDFLIFFLKNKPKNKIILIAGLEALNNLSIQMVLNKLVGLLIGEIPYILSFIRNENSLNLKVAEEIFELSITLLIKLNIIIHKELEKEIFTDVLNCLKIFSDCIINKDIKYILENGIIIISKIIEINEENEMKNNYKFLIESKGIKDVINNIINLDITIGIPKYLLNFLEIKI